MQLGFLFYQINRQFSTMNCLSNDETAFLQHPAGYKNWRFVT
jgi:hypothetical protein